ncbi:dephospho-CoA kinase, partial [Streptomyces niveus]
MLKVGLTGGIGAGKSEVSRLLVSYGAESSRSVCSSSSVRSATP